MTNLGGSDFDERIYEHAQAYYRENGIEIDRVDWKLMEACEAAKKALWKRNSARISHVRYGGAGFDLQYTTFVQLCVDHFERALTLTDKVLQDAAISEDDIDQILLVGGSTRIRYIREMLTERFPEIRIRDDIEPELAVAKGAAILAHSLSANLRETSLHSSPVDENSTTVNLIDVAPLQLGLCMYENQCKVLIRRNESLPFSTYELFTNINDFEETLYIEILEGESQEASQNHTLAEVEIEISPKPIGKNLIKVVLSIDVSGILSITAIDTHTSNEVSIAITSEKMHEREIVHIKEE
ncbi:hypothetical protein PMAYCL1PPCAC_03195, partial [Pristionchus mayeri]